MGPLWETIMGRRWVLQMTLAWVPHGFRWGPYGNLLGQHGPHVGYYYGTQMRFTNDFGMGPTWIHGARMGPFWDYMGPHRATIMGHS